MSHFTLLLSWGAVTPKSIYILSISRKDALHENSWDVIHALFAGAVVVFSLIYRPSYIYSNVDIVCSSFRDILSLLLWSLIVKYYWCFTLLLVVLMSISWRYTKTKQNTVRSIFSYSKNYQFSATFLLKAGILSNNFILHYLYRVLENFVYFYFKTND